MPITTSSEFVEQLRTLRILDEDQEHELTRDLAPRFQQPKDLARELIQRGRLTPFQINQLFQDRGSDLVLGQYLLLERLGEGGMGAVYKARHRKLDRIVAVKVIKPDYLSRKDGVRRFQREMKAAAKLSHANVVLIHDADEDRGRHYYVMEHLVGEDLSKLVRREGPLAVHRAVSYVGQGCYGLQHLHEHGMVHRDIKPQNLFLTGEGRQIKILDLGLALLEQEATTVRTALTQLGAVMGTADYIAPEQAVDAHKVDIRADVYSLGCTLYYLLNGKPPFQGGNVMQKIAWHMSIEPPAIETVRRDLPPGLGDVLRRMMAKKPDARYPTPAAAGLALAPFAKMRRTEGVSSGVRPAAPAPPPPVTLSEARDETDVPIPQAIPLGAPMRLPLAPPSPLRNRLIAGAVGLVVLVVGITILAGAFNKPADVERKTTEDIETADKDKPTDKDKPADEDKPRDKAPPDKTTRAAALVFGAREFLKAGNPDAALGMVAGAIQEDEGLIDAHLLMGEILVVKEDWTGVMACARKVLQLDPGNRSALLLRARGYQGQKAYKLALDDFNAAVEAAPKRADVRLARARCLMLMGSHDRAAREITEAMELPDCPTRAWLDRATAHEKRGVKVKARADLDEAKRRDASLTEEADAQLKAMVARLDKTLPDAASYLGRGIEKLNKKNHAGAVDDFDEALKLDPKLWQALQNRASCYVELGEFDLAFADCGDALRMLDKDKDKDRASVFGTLGHIYFRKGDYVKSAKAYERGLSHDASSNWLRRNRGFAYINQRPSLVDEALADADEVVKRDAGDASAHQLRGMALTGKGQLAEALKAFETSLALNPSDPWVHVQRSRTLRRVPDVKAALEAVSKAIELDGNFQVAFVDRADVHYEIGNKEKDSASYDSALADLDRAEQLKPDDPVVWGRRGAVLHMQGKYKESVAASTQGLALDPKQAWILRNRANAHEALGDKDKAAADRTSADKLEARP